MDSVLESTRTTTRTPTQPMTANPHEIRDLTMGSVAPALEAEVRLDQSFRIEATGKQTGSLLNFLQQYHAGLLTEVCAVDLTIYEYGLEGVPSFHLIGPSDSVQAYKEVVKELTTPEASSGEELSYSIALNPDFQKRNALKVIILPSLSDLDPSPPGTETTLVWERYPLEQQGFPRPEPADLEQALARFRALLRRRQGQIRSSDGHALRALLCCNFTLPELEQSGPLRAFGQLFLGLAALPFEPGQDRLRSEVANAIRDLGFLLYRGGSAGLLLGAGRDSSRATFAHEAKKLVQLVQDWPAPLTSYCDITEGAGPMTAKLKPQYADLRASDLAVVVLPEYFTAAANQILSWTMADSFSDLPFYNAEVGRPSLPATFRELLTACHDASVKEGILSMLRTAGSVHTALLGMRELDRYLRGKMPGLALSGSALELPAEWDSERSTFRLVDFCRLMMVIFREAIHHGSWTHAISVRLDLSSAGGLTMEATNTLRNSDADAVFEDAPGNLPLRREKLERARETLHNRTETFSRVGRQGRRQIAFLAECAGGKLSFITPVHSATPRAPWTVQCIFSSFFISTHGGAPK